MIEREGLELYVICDVCGERQHWMRVQYPSTMRFPLPEGWGSYRVLNLFTDFCPGSVCQKALAIMEEVKPLFRRS